MNNKPSRREQILTLCTVIMGCVLLAVIAGLIAPAYGRDPIEWASWTFSTLTALGVVICFGFWQMGP